MEDLKLNPEENNSKESSMEINIENIQDEETSAFTNTTEKASNRDITEQKENLDKIEKRADSKKSLFKRFLNDGFDGISTNPNYKMLGLLIILLINLSLFFLIGNLGKTFLRDAGIM